MPRIESGSDSNSRSETIKKAKEILQKHHQTRQNEVEEVRKDLGLPMKSKPIY